MVQTDRAEALELSKGLKETASNIERVSKKTNPEAAHWAFGQWALRKKAVAKGFPRADEMLFHHRGIEQATHFAIARYHASLFPPGVLVADLTTGIGSDLIALAERGPVVGFDTDSDCLECARHNLKLFGLEGQLVNGDCLSADWTFEYAIADPSRRMNDHVNGFRLERLETFQPSPSILAKRMEHLRLGLIKLSPMHSDPVLQTVGPRFDFISYGRECRESLVYLGKEAGSSGTRAPQQSGLGPLTAWRYPADMILEDGGSPYPLDAHDTFAVLVETGDAIPWSDPPMHVEEPLSFLYEADPAAIRAHGLGYLAQKHDLVGVGDSNGYLTSSVAVDSPWLVGYKVLGFGRFDKKTVRAQLAKLGGGMPVVKSRVARIDVVQVRKELGSKGAGHPIVAIYPVGASLRYAILERV